MKKTLSTLTLLVAMLTTSTVWAFNGTLTGSGSSINPYVIMDLEDWNTFTSLLNDPAYAPYYADKHYKLGANLGLPDPELHQYVTTWAADLPDYPFCGTFNGDGHAIIIYFTKTAESIDPNDETTQGVALFHYVSGGCEIHDLTVIGEIHSDYKFAAGIVSIIKSGSSESLNPVAINRCRSRVSFILGVEGDATSGGLVALSKNYVCLTMKDCLFDGGYNDPTANCCSGMVGYQSNDGKTFIESSYVSPYNLAIASNTNNHNFCRGNFGTYSLSNCYYTNPSFGDEQGTYVGSSPNPEHVAGLLGNWTVFGDTQPVPITINMVVDHCTLFSGFSAYSSYIPYNTNHHDYEDFHKLCDGNRLSKWCVCYPYSTHSSWEPIYVCFNYSQQFIPKGYVITTGNDVDDHPDRQPTNWSLYGWNETTGTWDLLDHHDDDDLPNINCTDRAFLLKDYENITTEYQKFEFRIDKIAREDKYWGGFFHGWETNKDDFVCELGEIRIFGTLSDADVHELSNCAINGLQPFYYYTGDVLPTNYFVTDYYNNELVKGPQSHYTDQIIRKYGNTTENVNINNIVESGEYTVTIFGVNNGHDLGYFGTNSYTFTVSSPNLPTPMGYTTDYGHTGPYYYVNMPATGQTTLDLTETDPNFTEPFYVYDDGGYSSTFTPNCDGMLLIKAPDGYGLQLTGKLQSSGYPYTYLTIYDGIDTTCSKLGDDYYGLYGTMQIPTMVSSGQNLLLHFQSLYDYSYMSGLELYVMPVEMPSYNDITLTDAEHGSLTTDMVTDVQASTQVRVDIHPETGYALKDINANATITSNYVELHGGTWYSGQTEYATFTMPASDVVITPTFAAVDSLYVCMPYYTNDLDQELNVIIPENITTFKVYDDGGPDGESSANSYSLMLLQAPENTILEFSGSLYLWNDANHTSQDFLNIYDGNDFGNLIETFNYGNQIIKMNTTSNQALLLFNTDGYAQLDGFEITVNVIGKTEDFGITITDVAGGIATIDGGATTAHINDTVKLNVITDAGYLCKDYTMTPDCGRPITGGVWHENPSQASFVMPGYNIEITPNITDTLTADGGLYINMPHYNYSYAPKVVTIPAGVTSFKVYDDGGEGGDYSPFCDGYMELHAPLGYFLKLSGNVTCNDKGTYHDFLKVYDGDSITSPPLGNPDGFGYKGDGLDFGPLVSTGNKMLLYFHSENNSMRGLNLLVEVSNEHFPYIITFDNSDVPANCSIAISGYESVSGTHYVAHVDHTISLNVNCDDNHLCNAFSVKDADGNEISLSGGLSWYNGNNDTASFTMLPRNLFITYEFVAKGDQYIKMPKKNTVDTPLQVTFPEGITSCKVYDDGGAEANYSDYCNGYALFTAPEGKVWQLTGIVKSEHGADFMVPYDGDTTTQLIDFYYYGKHTGDGEDIGGLVTFSNQMLIRFYSDYLVNYEGLDLTAELIDPITKTVEGYAAAPAGQDRWAFIAAPMKYYALPENVANLIPETNGIPDPTSSHYDLYRFNQSATLEWENYKSHINDFSLDVGQGYLYANMYTKTLQFGGAVNIGDSKTVALAYDANAGAKGWNLVGNPLLTDAYVDKPYYRMDEFGSNIEPVEHYRLLRVPVCTGIMVQAEGEGESITFSKTLPQFAHKGSLHIAVSGQNTAKDGLTIHDKTIVSFNEGTRLGKYVFNEDVAKLYIQKDGSDFAIAYSEQQGEVPVGFKAVEDGAYTLTITPENVETDYLHLIDNKTGTDIDLLAPELVEGPASYTFTATTMDDELRFRLVFSTHGLHENTEPAQPFAYYADGEIHLLVETQNEATLQVIDMLGRLVDSRDATCHISTSGMVPGVYVLRLMNGNDVKTQKIVIQ
jgi:hypothetical protein